MGLKEGKFNQKTKVQDKLFSHCFNLDSIIDYDYLAVKRISDIKKENLPDKNKALRCITTSNILSTEILKPINERFKIKNISLSYAVISEKSFEDIRQFKVIFLQCLDYKKYIDDKFLKEQKDTQLFFDCSNNLNAKTKIVKTCHLKNFVIECENDNYISVITSSNPKISSEIENYSIFNSKDFFYKMLNYFKCLNKVN